MVPLSGWVTHCSGRLENRYQEAPRERPALPPLERPNCARLSLPVCLDYILTAVAPVLAAVRPSPSPYIAPHLEHLLVHSSFKLSCLSRFRRMFLCTWYVRPYFAVDAPRHNGSSGVANLERGENTGLGLASKTLHDCCTIAFGADCVWRTTRREARGYEIFRVSPT